jgi:hypothetical protein
MSAPLLHPKCVVLQKQLGHSLLGPPSVSLTDYTLRKSEDACLNEMVHQKQVGPSLLGPPSVSLVGSVKPVSGPGSQHVRTIKGTDVLIYQIKGMYTTVEVKQRLTMHDLERKHKSDSPYYFIWNKNVKVLPSKLHGVLCFLCGKVWVVVTAIGRQALVVSLLPQRLAGEALIIQLDKTQGYYIQQVAGPCWSWVSANEGSHLKFPNSEYVTMSTGGPDIIKLPTGCSWWPKATISTVDWSHACVFYSEQGGKVKINAGDLMVPVVYVKDDEDQRFHITIKNTYLVPIGDALQETKHFKICSFAEIDETTLIEWLAIGTFEKEELKNMLSERAIAIVSRVIPVSVKGDLKIKLVNNDEFNDLLSRKNNVPLNYNGMEYIFGNEAKPGLDVGITISEWHHSNKVAEPRVTYKFFESCDSVYGHGFGSRSRSKCFGLNAYRDARTAKRPHPTPFVADEDIPQHQYFNKYLTKQPLLQPMLEKCLNRMARDIKRFAESLNPGFGYLCTSLCSKTIITCGTRPHKHAKKKSVLGFVNTAHVDSCDTLTKEQMEELKGKITNDCYLRLMNLKGFGLPTTCGYQFVKKEETEDKPFEAHQFFSLDGLGIAIPLSDGLGHYFYASTFAHRTCLGMIHHGSKVSITNKNDDFTILAWGASGGKTTAAAATNARNKRKACD